MDNLKEFFDQPFFILNSIKSHKQEKRTLEIQSAKYCLYKTGIDKSKMTTFNFVIAVRNNVTELAFMLMKTYVWKINALQILL